MKIVVHSAHRSSRLVYAADFVLGRILGFEVDYSSDLESEQSEDKLHLYYGNVRPAIAKIFLPAHPFLKEKIIQMPLIEVLQADDLPYFFSTPELADADLPFDLFALTFYLLSRFEEYDLSIQRDEHQRFSATSSLAFQQGFLHKPIIDCWAWRLCNLITSRFPNCPYPRRVYQFHPTIDVDFAWAYSHKNGWRTARTLIKSSLNLNFNLLKKQMNVLQGKEKDPFDTFDFLKEIHDKYHVKALFFILLGTYGSYDKNHPPKHPKMQSLIKQLSQYAAIGIHPSYASNNSFTKLEQEKNCLENTLNSAVVKSRQHFLKLHLPTTYQWLRKAGIKEDYSMGYADALGFRAGTAYPFFWYDLEKEEVSDLQVFPFAVMDVTLKNYLHLKPKEAFEKTAQIIRQINKTGGQFSLIWHNSSFSEEMGWQEWRGIYEKIVALASNKTSENDNQDKNAEHVST